MSDTAEDLSCGRCGGSGTVDFRECVACGGSGHRDDVIGDNVNSPPHYTAGTLEVIDAIEGMELGFHAGNVVKYVARYKHKNGVEDLRKAEWYLRRLIELETKEQG